MSISRSTIATMTGTVARLALVAAAGVLVAGCEERRGSPGSYRAYQPIPSDALALMREKGTDAHKPILIRAFKKEAELEIWKMRADGEYVHFKTYPMCRWSGQLGPKRREGDRQVPEGFYTITQGQLNPNSSYYLSFNVGYPNAYDKAHGYTGGLIMVHGDCSSAGCFSMTDEQIAEIYAIAREAFGGGQRAIQMQSLPFRMSAENLAKHRFDPNMKFWRQLKEGVDQFEVTKRETKVAICSKRYVFGASPVDGSARFDANAECPPLAEDQDLKVAVAKKQKHDEHQVAELVAKGVKPIKIVYADGGQHESFKDSVTLMSRPDAVAQAPKEIHIDEKGRPVPAAVQIASAKAEAAKVAAVSKPEAVTAAKPVAATAAAPSAPSTPAVAAIAVARTQTPTPAAPVASATAFAPPAPATSEAPFYKKWLSFGGKSEPAPSAAAPAAAPDPTPVATTPIAKPTPAQPKRQAGTQPVKPQAALAGRDKLAGAEPTLPPEFRAYAPSAR